MTKQRLYRFFIELTNNEYVSNLIRKFAYSKLSKRMIQSFASTYKIDLDEIEHPIEKYKTLHEFFTRSLKKGERQIDSGQETIISPVDGKIEDFGTIKENQSYYAKQKPYNIKDLLGDKDSADKYEGGTYVIIYLSPSNYHRIHSPYYGTVVKNKKLGLKSYPVNDWGLKYGKKPLSHNFRIITEFKSDDHYFTVAKIGAMFVNTIEVTYSNEKIDKGEEIGYFSFGSTVILLFSKKFCTLDPSIYKGQAIKMGTRIGSVNQNKL